MRLWDIFYTMPDGQRYRCRWAGRLSIWIAQYGATRLIVDLKAVGRPQKGK